MHEGLLTLDEAITSGGPLNVTFATPAGGGVLFFNTPADVRDGRIKNLRDWAQLLRKRGAGMPEVMDSTDLMSIAWDRGELAEFQSEDIANTIFVTSGGPS